MNRNSGRDWVNFRELRARLKFADVLAHYKVTVVAKGGQHQGPCPLPRHTGSRDAPSFSANLERGIFQCFGCKATGNLLEFAGLMSGVDPEDGAALRRVAVELQKRFLAEGSGARKGKPGLVEAPRKPAALVNAPLDFELKGLDPAHPYLARRGFRTDTAEHFGAGFCSRGLLRDRIAIPLHDADGRLVGYAGRLADDGEASGDNPRYVFPEARERDGTRLEFDKGLFLYNGHRLRGPFDDLAVVEGFPSVWWLHQHGYAEAVAVMGTQVSERQIELIVGLVRPSGRVWIIPDGNRPGERLAEALLKGISPHRLVRWVRLEEDQQPTDLKAEHLENFFVLDS